ncbi:hypothetical protein M422DRAFT_28789 [Sphaerobolus stellatus SS14]|nr:hypothetical protein M422DRAFT_28789 [Sphaerobolus stellatus SS14]
MTFATYAPAFYTGNVVATFEETVQSTFVQEASDLIELAGFVLLLYDVLLTLKDEVDYIWSRNLRLGSILYCLARYGTIITITINILVNFGLFHISWLVGLILVTTLTMTLPNRILRVLICLSFCFLEIIILIGFKFDKCSFESQDPFSAFSISYVTWTLLTDAAMIIYSATTTCAIVWQCWKVYSIMHITYGDTFSFSVIFIRRGKLSAILIYRFFFELCERSSKGNDHNPITQNLFPPSLLPTEPDESPAALGLENQEPYQMECTISDQWNGVQLTNRLTDLEEQREDDQVTTCRKKNDHSLVSRFIQWLYSEGL